MSREVPSVHYEMSPFDLFRVKNYKFQAFFLLFWVFPFPRSQYLCNFTADSLRHEPSANGRVLHIINPEQFWSVSNFLVILAE